MNNKAEKFHRDNKEVIQQFIERLDAILNKFDAGIIPGEPEKSDLLYILDKYMGFLVKFKEEELPAFKKFTESAKTSYDETVAVKELSGLKSSISILTRICREKMLSAENDFFTSEEGKILIDYGYCEEISAEESGLHYYILSEKGEKAIKSKSVLRKLRTDLATAVVPLGMVIESTKWSNLYLRRVELINDYFKKIRDDAEHIVFSLDESKEMVFGCEVSDSTDVKYVFAGIFDEKINENISQLKGIADSGLVDQLIIVSRFKGWESLLVDEGLDPRYLPQISYVFVK